MRKGLIAFMLMAAVTYIPVTEAANGTLIAGITRVLAHKENLFGGCMALMSKAPSTVLPDCVSRWISFSCTGDFNAKDHANRMYDNAQMAMALNRRVKVVFSDLRKHNGHCVAHRIDVFDSAP